MNVCVAGLWHLGSVTAACLAGAGHTVVGYDRDRGIVDQLANGRAPVLEPGLEELLRAQIDSGRLTFTSDAVVALGGAEALWITWDTPVDDDDRADVDLVFRWTCELFPYVEPGAIVIVSSQLPVGAIAKLERAFAALRPGINARFACSPENLRLGKAIEVFSHPDRIVVGTRRTEDRERVAALLAPITDRIEWMSVESAEVTKHALNAFLATSVAFINEVATICERVGADAGEVARGLKSDVRIGPRAYLSPGGAFAGGTLARDLVFLGQLGEDHRLRLSLLPSVRMSNEVHRNWAAERLQQLLGSMAGRTVAVWGLAYKPGTDTLRRSSAVAFCQKLAAQGAAMRAFDPAVRVLPREVARTITLTGDAIEAVHGADALVVATEWPSFRDIGSDQVVNAGVRTVLDANRFLSSTLGADPRLTYMTVGRPA